MDKDTASNLIDQVVIAVTQRLTIDEKFLRAVTIRLIEHDEKFVIELVKKIDPDVLARALANKFYDLNTYKQGSHGEAVIQYKTLRSQATVRASQIVAEKLTKSVTTA